MPKRKRNATVLKPRKLFKSGSTKTVRTTLVVRKRRLRRTGGTRKRSVSARRPSRVSGSTKLAAAKRASTSIVRMPRMLEGRIVKFPVYETYEFTITPKDRTAYMTTASTESGIASTCQSAIGFFVNLNAPHQPFDLFSNTVNIPKPNDPTTGIVIQHQQPRGMRELVNYIGLRNTTRTEYIVCYSTDVSWTIERPDHEIYERANHGFANPIATGITHDGAQTASGVDYISHNGNNCKYLVAGYISHADSNFLSIDGYHANYAHTYNRIDRSHMGTFKRNLLSRPKMQPTISELAVPEGKKKVVSGKAKWSITDHPLALPHPLDSKSSYGNHLWHQQKDTDQNSIFDDYCYKIDDDGTEITNLATIAPSKTVKYPVFIQPINALGSLTSNVFDDGDGSLVDRTDSMFDLPYVRVKLRLRYNMAIMPGKYPDGVSHGVQPQFFDENHFTPTVTTDP